MSCAPLVLNHHYLEFNGTCWHQIQGTIMNSNFTMAYACSNLYIQELFLDMLQSIWGPSICYITNATFAMPLEYEPTLNGFYAKSYAYTVPL